MSLAFPRRVAAAALLFVPSLAMAQQSGQPARNNAAAPKNSAPAAKGQPAAPSPPSAPAEKRGQAGGDAGAFKSFEEKLSYALGVNMARRMQLDNVHPEPQSFARGVVDELSKKKTLLTDEEMTAVLQQYGDRLREEAAAARKQLKEEWSAAFSEKKKPEGEPKATKSGLKYEVYQQGKGTKPKPTDTVVVNYVGTFPDGKQFDSSLDRGGPAVFPVNEVIPGWTEGLQLMPVGSRYKFYIPSALGYGEQGFPPAIKPNQDLVFEVELVDIVPPQGQGEGTPPAPPATEGANETPPPK